VEANGCEQSCYLAECLWPGVTEADARAVDGRLRHDTVASASDVQYFGYLLMPEDEVLFCVFRGGLEEVRLVSEEGALPFERIVSCSAVGLLRCPSGKTAPSIRGAAE
jgi:hypothetical protein